MKTCFKHSHWLSQQPHACKCQSTLIGSRCHCESLYRPLLTNLFAVLERGGDAENEYVVKAVMRVVTVAKEEIAPAASAVLERLQSVLPVLLARKGNGTG